VPEGSNRSNHRQDQAVLTALVYLLLSDDGEMFDQVHWAGEKVKGEFSAYNDVDFSVILRRLGSF